LPYSAKFITGVRFGMTALQSIYDYKDLKSALLYTWDGAVLPVARVLIVHERDLARMEAFIKDTLGPQYRRGWSRIVSVSPLVHVGFAFWPASGDIRLDEACPIWQFWFGPHP
jgi:hypothetical protein